MQKDYKFKVSIFEIFNQQNNMVQALKIHLKLKVHASKTKEM